MPKNRPIIWQAMDSAPTDGRYVLLSAGPARNVGSNPVVMARYTDGIWSPMFTSGAYMGAIAWTTVPEASVAR